MNINEKYNIKVILDQFGNTVPENFIDVDEIILINKFEEYLLDLKANKKSLYTMIELGSNHAYYSLLFKSILKNTKQIMLEPYDIHMQRGKKHFELDGFEGIFLNNSIGNKWFAHPGIEFDNSITVDQLIYDNFDSLDVLHSDIDGSELLMLEGCVNSLKNKKIEYLFILTHGSDIHSKCLKFVSNYDYTKIFESRNGTVGSDGLIIIKKN